ncbi:MAG TPA: hypothetical protein VNA04_18385 [Thermoanaerobaculia bacterium]|nr:hypothetical protein [Thermoanaerobaculia bacterium]
MAEPKGTMRSPRKRGIELAVAAVAIARDAALWTLHEAGFRDPRPARIMDC